MYSIQQLTKGFELDVSEKPPQKLYKGGDIWINTLLSALSLVSEPYFPTIELLRK